MELRVLGSIEVHNTHQLAIGGARHRRIVAALAMRAGEVVSLDQLVDVVWPLDEEQPKQPERNLRTYLSRIRSSLGDELADRLTTAPPGYVLRVDRSELDALRFEDAAAAASRACERGGAEEALAQLEVALAAWRGRPYAEFADENWARAEVARLEEVRAHALETKAQALLDTDRPSEALPTLEVLIEEQPLRERPRELLMTALARSGRQPEALRAFRDFRRLLIDEVGVEPGGRLVDLDRRIASGDVADGSAVEQVQGYDVFELIGSGAFADVHRGRQAALGRDVAIKSIRAELANHADFIRGFEVEAAMVARLEHPHIVPLYDFWREPDRAYLVMRWLDGGTLEARLDDGPWPADRTARMIEQVGSALALAHRAGVVHRDVKSANILLDREDNAYLSDFGIAVQSAGRENPAAALSEGSPAHAAPEQLRRERVGPPADIFGLGIAAYEALTGGLPFADARNPAELLRRQLDEPIPLVTTARPELPPALDDVLARATAKDPAQRFQRVDQFVDAFLEAVGPPPSSPAEPPRGNGSSPASGVLVDNPYVGLRAFSESDEARFFGRARLVDEVLAQLADDGEGGRFVTVVGPSGSGKSSLVRAGVVPALRGGAAPGSAGWFITTMTPGHQPFEALEAALLRIAVNPPTSLVEQLRESGRGIVRGVRRILPDDDGVALVVIDQFEEVFTLCDDEEARSRFLDALTVAATDPTSRVRFLITLRADFYDHPLRYEGFADLVKRHGVTVTPLAADELEQAIVRPAEAAGVVIEPGLVSEIVADAASQPGALPLMQYALSELFAARISGMLMVRTYRELGGIGGALARRADELYTSLEPGEQTAARRIFGRLVTLGEGSEDTRRRTVRSELGLDAEADRVIDVFGTARLLSFDRDVVTREPTVEVAHEALIREWPRLRSWIDADRDGLRIQRHLTAAATDWDALGRPDAELYRGGRLDDAAAYAAGHGDDLTTTERAFVDGSVESRDREAAATHRANRRLRRLVTAVSIVAVLALVAGVIALVQQREAQDERAAAEAASAASETSRMAAEALTLAPTDPQLALLLAAEAHRREANPETVGSLQQTMLRTGNVLGFVGEPGRGYHATRWAGDGDTLVAVHSDGIDVIDAARNAILWSDDSSPPALERQLRSLTAGDFAIFEVSDDGRFAGLATVDGGLTLFGIEDRSVTRLSIDTSVSSLAFSPDGMTLVTGHADGTTRLWNTDGSEVRRFAAHPESSPYDFDEQLLELGVDLRIADADNAAYLPAGKRGVSGIAFADEGRVLITAEPPVVRVWSVDEDRLLDEHIPTGDLTRFGAGVYMPVLERLEPGPPGSDIVGFVGRLNVYTLNWRSGGLWQAPVPTDRLDSNTSATGAVYRPDGTWVTSLSDGRVRALDAEGDPVWTATHRLALPSGVAVHPQGGRVAVSAADGIVVMALDGSTLLSTAIPRADSAIAVAVSADGQQVTQGAFVAQTQLWRRDADSRFEQVDLPEDLARQAIVPIDLPDGRTLLDAFDQTQFPLNAWYSDDTFEEITRIEAVILGLGFSPDGRLFATMRSFPDAPYCHRIVGVWETETWSLVAETDEADLPALTQSCVSIASVTFSADGRLMMATTEEGVAGLWSTDDWQPLPIPVELGPVINASYSPNGELLATVGADGVITLRDTESFEPVRTLSGASPPGPLGGSSVTWSLDGSLLLSQFDAQPRLWDVAAGEQLGDPFPNDPEVSYRTVGGTVAVTAFGDVVHVWNTDPSTWAETACRAAGRNLTREEWAAFGPRDEPYQRTCPQYPPAA